MHNKENQLHESFYKEIGHEILKYNHILVFGPTNAKTELLNYLKKDLHFKDIQIDIKSADKMTENEKYAFVWTHFEKD
jgi:stalled ribosome rescue protein Dom34